MNIKSNKKFLTLLIIIASVVVFLLSIVLFAEFVMIDHSLPSNGLSDDIVRNSLEKNIENETKIPDENLLNDSGSEPDNTKTENKKDDKYSKSVDGKLVILDDKAGVLNEIELEHIIQLAERTCKESGYNIMIVTAKDMFGLSDKEFADRYYDELIELYGNKKSFDGYLFLINFVDRTYWLSTCGSANEKYTKEVTDELFEKVTPYLSSGNYEKAISLLIA